MQYDVVGVGSPLIDLLVHVSDDFLKEKNLQKNRMYLVDLNHQQELLLRLMSDHKQITFASGGSCANTMIGLQQLGGKGAFCGKVGKDDHGRIYREKMSEVGVTTLLAETEGVTGSCLVLVSDDAARTLNTHLGVSQALHEDDLELDCLAKAKYLYLEGYLWDTDNQKQAVLAALQNAKNCGAKVSLSLSDPFCVNRHRADFENLLKNSVDLVFCNQEEASALTHTHISQLAVERIGQWVDMVVMTMGGRGALVYQRGTQTYIDPMPVNVVDTTGAGDAFAAGFLYGLTQGKSLLESGRIASFLASQVISITGARLDTIPTTELKQYLGAH